MGIRSAGATRRRWAARAAAVALGVGALLGVACTSSTDVTLTTPQQTGIVVSGEGTATVVPDVGVFSAGVEVSRPTVAAAREEAAKAMDALRAAVRRLGVEERDIRTQAFNIHPQYSSRTNGGRPVITGYTVSNTVSVKVRKLDDLSRVLDAAVAAGGDAVRVQGIGFEVDDPARAQAEARERAMADARARAEQLAKAAGASLGKVRAVSEAVGGGPEVLLRAPAAAPSIGGGDTATPVSPGESEVRVTVNVVYDLD
jgi:uncharacterized protein YggE